MWGGVQTPEQAEKLRKQEQNKLEKYQKASKDAEEFNRNGSTQLINAVDGTKQYSNVLKVTQNPIKEIHVTSDEYWNKKSEIQKDYATQTKDILNATQNVKEALDKAKKQFDLENTTNLVDSHAVTQKLKLVDEWEAKVSYKIEGSAHLEESKDIETDGWAWGNHKVAGIPQGTKLKQYIFSPDGNKPQTYTINVVTTNLKNSYYKGKKISKIVSNYTIKPNSKSKLNELAFFNNPMSGLDQRYGTLKLHYEFYDENGNKINFTDNAYISVGSLNNYQNFKDHYEYARVLSGGKALGLLNSSVSVHDNDYLYSTYPNSDNNTDLEWAGKDGIFTTDDGMDYVVKRNMKLAPEFKAASEWDSGWANPNAYYGAGLIRLQGNQLDLEVGLDGYQHFTTIDSRDRMPWNSQWYNIATVIPETPIKKDIDAIDSYNTYKLIVDKPEITVIPEPTKDVSVGSVDGIIKDSANGKTVLKGQQLTYTLDTIKFSSLRKDQSKIEWKDTLPNEVTFNSLKIETPEGKDISNQFEINHQGQNISVKAKPEYLQEVNKDRSQEFALAVPHLYVTVNKDNADFKNNYTLLLDSGEFLSNEVENKTPGFTTKKQVFDDNSKNIDKQMVRKNQVLNYVGDLDLTKLDNLSLSDDLLEKGISLTDNFDSKRLEVTQATKNSLKVYLADDSKAKGLGQEIDSNDYKVNWTDTSWKVSLVKDKEVISKYAGKKLRILFKPTVKQTAEGTIYNRIIPNYFGEQIESNRVENPISYEVMPQTGSKKLLIVGGITVGLILISVVGITLYKKK